MRFRHAVLALIALLASAALGVAALPDPNAPPESRTLTGQLLVADPQMGDPYFRHTVILLVRQGPGGALGIILNRPIGQRPWTQLLKAVGADDSGVAGNVTVFNGGPVEPWNGFVVHSADWRTAGTMDIDGRVAMTSNLAVLRELAHGKGPKQSLLAFGYSGWAPGQLEHEMAMHGWFAIPADPKLIFDTERDRLWDEAVARRTIPL